MRGLLLSVPPVLARAAAFITSLCLVAMVVIVFWQVFSRYVLDRTPAWSEECAQLLTLYFALIGSAFAYRERLHIGVEFLKRSLPDAPRRGVETFLDALVGLFGVFMALWGVSLVQRTLAQTLPGTGLPTGISYVPLPVTGVLLVVFSIEKVSSERSR